MLPFLLLMSLGIADDDEEESDSEVIVVTSTRTEKPWVEDSQAGSVLNAEDMADQNSVNEGLENATGVSINNHGGLYYWNPVIRGLSGRRVIMLIDGLRIPTDKSMGVTGFFVNSYDAAAVEVVRGSGAVMYGSDALGGIINIKLKSPFEYDGFSGSINSLISTNNLVSEGASFSLTNKRISFGLSARRRDAQNYKDGNGNYVEQSYFHDNMFSGHLAFKPNNVHTITLRSQNLIADDIGKAETELDREKHRKISFPKDNVYRASLNWNIRPRSGPVKKADLSVYGQLTDRINLVQTFNSDYSTLVTDVSKKSIIKDFGGLAFSNLPLGEKNQLTMGIDGSWKTLVQTSSNKMYQPNGSFLESSELYELDGAIQSSLGVFVQNELKTEPLNVVFGIREDIIFTDNGLNNSIFNQATSGNIGLNYFITKKFTFNANFGRAFRAPTIQEKFLTTSTCLGTMCGDPNLKPESSLNGDIGLKAILEKTHFELYSFAFVIDNLITARNINNECDYTYTNTAEAFLYGIEGSLKHKFKLNSNWLYLEPEILGTWVTGQDIVNDEPLPSIPPFSTKLMINLGGKAYPKITNWFFEPELSWASKQTLVAPDENPTESHFLFGLKAGLVLNSFWKINDLRISLKGSNLLNSYYEPHLSSTPGQGREIRMGAHLTF